MLDVWVDEPGEREHSDEVYVMKGERFGNERKQTFRTYMEARSTGFGFLIWA